MRWILLILVLLNGGFFAWQYYTAGTDSMASHEEALDGGHDPLTLISELSDEQKKVLGVVNKSEMSSDTGTMQDTKPSGMETESAEMAEAKEADKPAAAEKQTETQAMAAEPMEQKAAPEPEPAKTQKMPAKYCYALGPMKNQKLVKRVQGRVSSMGLAVEVVRNEVEEIPTNWIYIGPMKTEADAKRMLSRLHSKGFKDTQMIKKAADNFIISVGLFSTKKGADERLKRLQDAGFTPNLSKVMAKKSNYWIDVNYQGGKKIDVEILRNLVGGIKGAGVKEIDCK